MTRCVHVVGICQEQRVGPVLGFKIPLSSCLAQPTYASGGGSACEQPADTAGPQISIYIYDSR